MTIEITPELQKWVVDRSNISVRDRIGEGAYGTVSRGMIGDDPYCAFKELRPFSNENDIKKYIIEITALAACDHPCIVPLVGFIPDVKQPTIVTRLMVHQSLCHLNNLYSGHGRYKGTTFRKDQLAIVFYGVACGMAFLHKNHIIHRDLKPGNILLGKGYLPYISDFGCAKFVDEDGSISFTIVGTLLYMAPEIHEGQKYTHKVDVYSFGITLLVSLSPKGLPLKLVTEEDRIVEITDMKVTPNLVSQIVKGEAVFVKPGGVSDEYWQLIQDCLKRSADERPEFTEIMERMRDEKFATGNAKKYLAYIQELKDQGA